MQHRRLITAALAITAVFTLGCGLAAAQTTSFSAVVDTTQKLTLINTGVTFDTAGTPFWVDGNVYFTNNIYTALDRCITYRIDASGAVTPIVKGNGGVTTIAHSGKGTFFCTELMGHRITEIDRDGKVLRVLATEYNGKRLDNPNDLTVDAKGGIYFSDSHFTPANDLQQDKPAVYYISPKGVVTRVIDDLSFPNGVELSSNGKILYALNTQGADKGQYVYAYDVQADGSLINKRQFCEVRMTPADQTNRNGSSGADGSAVDQAGNLYLATNRGLGIQVFNSTGTYLGAIPCAAATNNIFFGGKDGKTIYVSAKNGIYTMPVKIAGAPVPVTGK